MTVSDLEARPPRSPQETQAVGNLLFGPSPEGPHRPDAAVELGQTHTLGAWLDRNLIGAIAWRREADDSAFVWHPNIAAVTAGSRTTIAAQLIQRALDQARREGCRFGITYADPSESSVVESLSLTQFAPLTTFLCLRRPTTALGSVDHRHAGRLVEYKPEFRRRFLDVFERTRTDSGDCARLNALRSAEDVFEIFANSGPPGARREWMTWEETGRDVGLVLVTDSWHEATLEILYLGVVPTHRRRGIGTALLAASIDSARRRGLASVETSVDADNWPARLMYEAAQFERTAKFDVFFQSFSH